MKNTKRKSGNTAPDFPIVGIGASAGGLAAFEAFFSGMPADMSPDMAFVLVQHLAPDHKSILADLIQRYTHMQVCEVEDGMVIQPNHAYIIPPNHDMAFLNGTLQLLAPSAPHGQRLPIDFFFRSLAQDLHERAICIVLSGTGSDGTLGVRAVKGEGGMVIVQTPSSTEYDGMPCSAIATGLVDYELPPAEMPAKLIAYVAHSFGKPSRVIPLPEPRDDNALKKIFILLRNKTGHDFSQYKQSTIIRRIERRMAVQQIETIDEYVQFLQIKQAEMESLFRDLLIGVTSFFRDPEAFKAFETLVVPQLFADKPAGSVIRVWSPGCSTGEEAFSIAILLQERLEVLKQSYRVQIFATDIDNKALAVARNGLYPASITADITPERLSRFFVSEPDGNTYRIHKGIRDMLIISEQDVIKDPPFSKLDLISCRNLLIYMGGDLQKKLIPLFHYALNPSGFLFLGTSETVGESVDIFTPLDGKAKIYKRKTDLHNSHRLLTRSLPVMASATFHPTTGKKFGSRKFSLRALTEQALLHQVAAAGALVNEQGDILYLHGRTGLYLEPTPGETGVSNILKMAREGLQRELTIALHKATSGKQVVHCPNLRVKTNGHFSTVNLTIRPVSGGPETSSDAPLYLISLEEIMPTATPSLEGAAPSQSDQPAVGSEQTGSSESVIITALKQKLQDKEDFLQSANEELETSKEELQSINEELATVNTELQLKVTELTRANNDMSNLLAGTGIATIFVDHDLHILRFTPATTKIINLIQTDVGRPVGHIVSNLVDYNRLPADTQAVLDNLTPKDVEVQSLEGSWYSIRIRPYRTKDNVIEGAVITFVDITATKDAERNAESFRRLAALTLDSNDAIIIQGLTGKILSWNPRATSMYGWSESEGLTMNIQDLIPENQRHAALSVLKDLSHSKIIQPYRSQRISKTGRILNVMLTATALVNGSGQAYAIATTEREVNTE
ncbi:MAG: chemotaxis protein CheB [bacterium]